MNKSDHCLARSSLAFSAFQVLKMVHESANISMVFEVLGQTPG